MKLLLGALSLLLSLSAHAAAPDYGVWHKVLSCDGGAVVIDNEAGYGRGGDGLAAQIVVRDANVVAYFQKSGARGSFVDGQWIGNSFFEPMTRGPITSWQTFDVYVAHDGASLTLVSGQANWRFGNCLAQ